MDRIIIRNIRAAEHLELFLVSAVSSILAIRVFLRFTNYPQLGGEGFHISHMLIGGTFMVIAMIFILSYLGSWILKIGAILGGIGFGIFIDELGKFITADNNYFFQPTIALIYLIFIFLFFVYKYYAREQNLNAKEYAMNALEGLEEVVFQEMEKDEQRTVLNLLKKADPDDPMVIQLKQLISQIDTINTNKKSFTYLAKIRLKSLYRYLLNLRFFRRLIILFFIGYAIFSVIENPAVILFFTNGLKSQLTFYQISELLSSLISALLILFGTIRLATSKLAAYSSYRRAILVSILVTQIFVFYREQLSAISVLFINIIILIILDYMINQEKAYN